MFWVEVLEVRLATNLSNQGTDQRQLCSIDGREHMVGDVISEAFEEQEGAHKRDALAMVCCGLEDVDCKISRRISVSFGPKSLGSVSWEWNQQKEDSADNVSSRHRQQSASSMHPVS